MKILPLCVLALMTAACQNVRDTPPASVNSLPTAEPVDVWDRSRQCADHADRLATREQRVYERSPQDDQVVKWNSHYNQKEKRCYVEIVYYSQKALKEQKGIFPPFYKRLYDAVESLEVAAHTTYPLSDKLGQDLFCRVPSRSGDRSTTGAECSAAEKFILERMTN
jgi:hypothetical protein